MDKVDEYISKVIKKDVQEPLKYEYTIKHALENNKKQVKITNVIQKIIITIISISAIGGIVLAVQMYKEENNKKDINYETNNSEYIQNISMEYQTIDNLSIKINSILVDEYSIQLNIDYLYNEPMEAINYGIAITDDYNNLIYYSPKIETEENFEKLNRNEFIEDKDFIQQGNTYKYKENNSLKEFDEQDEYTEASNININQKDDNNIEETINLLIEDLNCSKFPNSNKFKIKIVDASIINEGKVIKEINGEWDLEVNIDKKSESIKDLIQVKSQEKPTLEVLKAKKTNTKVLLKIKNNGTESIDEILSNEIQILDEKNNIYLDATDVNGNTEEINIVFDINKDMFSDFIKIKILNNEEILLKEK